MAEIIKLAAVVAVITFLGAGGAAGQTCDNSTYQDLFDEQVAAFRGFNGATDRCSDAGRLPGPNWCPRACQYLAEVIRSRQGLLRYARACRRQVDVIRSEESLESARDFWRTNFCQ
jgi:hypothetical protein